MSKPLTNARESTAQCRATGWVETGAIVGIRFPPKWVAKSELSFEELAAFPLSPREIDAVLDGLGALLADGIRDVLLFYYPRDWRLSEVMWTPIPEKVLHVKEKYQSASSVIAVILHSEDVCMISFWLSGRPTT